MILRVKLLLPRPRAKGADVVDELFPDPLHDSVDLSKKSGKVIHHLDGKVAIHINPTSDRTRPLGMCGVGQCGQLAMRKHCACLSERRPYGRNLPSGWRLGRPSPVLA